MPRLGDVGVRQSGNYPRPQGGRGTIRHLMVPWPGATQAMRMLREDPGIDVGIHLSVICDMPSRRHGPLAGAEAAPSLTDESGMFYGLERKTGSGSQMAPVYGGAGWPRRSARCTGGSVLLPSPGVRGWARSPGAQELTPSAAAPGLRLGSAAR